jgi:aminoglycoside/choline kinase family phosphotransferase
VNARDRVVRLYERHYGVRPAHVHDVAADGSARRYYRLPTPESGTVIGGYGPDRGENRAFLSFSATLHEAGLPVPGILAVNRRQGTWLEDDLGDSTLFDLLAEARRTGTQGPDAEEAFPEEALAVYRRVIELLPRFQVEGGRILNFRVAYPRRAFDRQSMLWDLNYFKYHFLKLAHVPFDEAKLERDFGKLVRFLLKAPRDHFMYRDFQSRNIMVVEGEPWFIDYQGGRRGALQYDLASLLYDAKADLPPEVRAELLECYLGTLEGMVPVDREPFLGYYRGFVLIRIMQALGAYGYRGFFERKPRFLQSVPFAARNLDALLEEGLPLALPEIESTFSRIVERWAGPDSSAEETPGLSLRVASFSYRNGYPEDTSSHGGGYVFDCRGIPNPGRLAEFVDQTGLDEPVVEFLAARPETEAFWDGVRRLVEAHIDAYRQRGFNSLSISFGCTGGQHRSVYFAERLTRHVRENNPDVNVIVRHRERRGWPGAGP